MVVVTDMEDMAVPTEVMAATSVATTARGLLMPSLRLMLLLRPSPVMAVAMAATDMVATAMVGATAATARGLLSPAMATGATAMVVMVATATAGATATGVSYHQIRRSELSQKQNHKNS